MGITGQIEVRLLASDGLVQFQAAQLICCVTLGDLLNFSVLQSLHLPKRG